MVDARRGEVFAAAYGFDAVAPRPTAPTGPPTRPVRADRPAALSPDELVAWLDALAADGPVLVVGDGAVRYAGCWRPGPGSTSAGGRLAAPPPAVLARLAAGRLAAGRPRAPAAEWCPTTGGPPTPASTGRSGPRRAGTGGTGRTR